MIDVLMSNPLAKTLIALITMLVVSMATRLLLLKTSMFKALWLNLRFRWVFGFYPPRAGSSRSELMEFNNRATVHISKILQAANCIKQELRKSSCELGLNPALELDLQEAMDWAKCAESLFEQAMKRLCSAPSEQDPPTQCARN